MSVNWEEVLKWALFGPPLFALWLMTVFVCVGGLRAVWNRVMR